MEVEEQILPPVSCNPPNKKNKRKKSGRLKRYCDN